MPSTIDFSFLLILLSRTPDEVITQDQMCRKLEFRHEQSFNGKRLINHVINFADVNDEELCGSLCFMEHNCVSYNFEMTVSHAGLHRCELNNATHESHEDDLVDNQNFFYRGAKSTCVNNPCQNNSTCQIGFTDKKYRCLCTAGFTGESCENDIDECATGTHKCTLNDTCNNTHGSYDCTPIYGLYSHNPARSCKNIKDVGTSKGDGEYWIRDPGRIGNPLKVYCDMTTDGGGWLLISNVVSQGSSPAELPVKTSYRGVSNKQMLLTKSAMTELRMYLHFAQIRYYCRKNGGRTFHIVTAANSTGQAVVRYLSGETDTMPASCGSFVIMSNDNSRLARVCKEWGYEGGNKKVGKWGLEGHPNRLYDHPAFVNNAYHWVLRSSKWECDDYNVGVSPGDFWKIFVR